MKKLALAGVALLIVLAAVAPLVTGAITESSWDDLNAEFNKSGEGLATLETLEYDRGYLGTDILSRMTLTIPELESPLELHLRTVVSHGLWEARTETRLDPEHHADWLARFGDNPPALLADVAANGNVDGSLSIPALVEALPQGGQLSSQPALLAFRLTDDANQAEVNLTWGGAEFDDGQNRFSIENLSLEEELSRLIGDLWVGDVRFSIEALSARSGDGGSLDLSGVSLAGGTHEVENGRLQNKMDFNIGQIDVDEQPFGDMQMAFVADDFDIEATNAVLIAGDRLSNASVDGGTESELAVEQLRLFGEFMSALRNLMAKGLTLGIPSLLVNTPEGAVTLQFSFGQPVLDEGQRESMMSLFQYSQGGLSLKLPSALLDKTPEQFQQQIFQLYQQGLIQETNGELLLDIELDKMTLDINGHRIQIPPLI